MKETRSVPQTKILTKTPKSEAETKKRHTTIVQIVEQEKKNTF